MPTVLDAVGVPVPNEVDGKPRRTPEEIVSEHVLSVSQPPSGTPTYRAIRRSSGWRLFGRDTEPTDDIVLTRYENHRSAGETTEEIAHATTTDDGPKTEPAATHWDDLMAELVDTRGPPIEERERSDPSTSVDEAHL
jgi:hypothetical protein